MQKWTFCSIFRQWHSYRYFHLRQNSGKLVETTNKNGINNQCHHRANTGRWPTGERYSREAAGNICIRRFSWPRCSAWSTCWKGRFVPMSEHNNCSNLHHHYYTVCVRKNTEWSRISPFFSWMSLVSDCLRICTQFRCSNLLVFLVLSRMAVFVSSSSLSYSNVGYIPDATWGTSVCKRNKRTPRIRDPTVRSSRDRTHLGRTYDTQKGESTKIQRKQAATPKKTFEER